MKTLYILFFLIVPAVSYGDVYKCRGSGGSSYSDSSCGSGSVAYRSDLLTLNNAPSQFSVSVPLSGGAYNMVGEVNGSPVNFILDTGASSTVISGDTAYAMGIRTCQITGQTSTAAGVIGHCSMVVRRLVVAGVLFSDVVVSISPTMRGRSLLGNDLLSRFRIEQRGGVMTLSR